MKQFKLFLLLTAFCGSLALSACSNDDDEGGNTSALVGTWLCEDGALRITFNSNGSGTYQEYIEEEGGWENPDLFNYSYIPSTNTVNLFFDSERETYQIVQLTDSMLSWFFLNFPNEVETFYRIK